MSRDARRRRSRRGTGSARLPAAARGGQGLVEVAVGMLVFVLVATLVLDASWLYFHQITLTQGAHRLARRASTNAYTRKQLRKAFFRSLSGTQAAAGDPSVTRLTITTMTADPAYATQVHPLGRPSVMVAVTHAHRPLMGLGSPATIELEAESRAPVETWAERPGVAF